MERLARRDEKRDGISRSALRLWGLLFAIPGVVSRAIIQNGLLNMGSITNEQLLEAMMGSGQTMAFATLALVLQALEACAIPIFAFLLERSRTVPVTAIVLSLLSPLTMERMSSVSITSCVVP